MSNLQVAAAFATAAIGSIVSGKRFLQRIVLSGNVNKTKGTQHGPTKIAKRYDICLLYTSDAADE